MGVKIQQGSLESSSPFTGIIALLLVAGAVAVQNVPLESSRLRNPEKVKDQSVGKEDVDARLWQDPFASMTRHIKENKTQPLSPGGSGLEVEIVSNNGPSVGLKATLKAPKNTDYASHSIDSLELSSLKNKDKLVVLGAMVPGGPYPDDEEWRRRMRYAVVAGLTTSKYFSHDPNHIGFIQVTPKDKKLFSPKYVPYEWFFKENSEEPLLLLWLDDDAFKPEKGGLNTLAKLAGFVELIESNLWKNAKLRLNILGPRSSTTLKYMIEEMLDIWKNRKDKTSKDKTSDDILKYMRKIYFYSPIATALDVSWVRQELKKRKMENSGLNVRDIFDNEKIYFVSTIGEDSSLIKQLMNELHLRGINKTCGNDLAVVYEMDTDYGRMLRKALESEMAEKESSSEKCVPVRNYSYLRGLDGQYPGASAAPVSEKPAKDDKDKSSDAERMERAEGDSQLDYLRRLATIMREDDKPRDRDEQLKAIGIFGSDLYDKLLILQALRGQFPDAIFFTTDLDARLLHPRETKWARNLIVASHFGFNLHEEWQKNVPPFRDSYQTSMFLATKLALDNQTDIPPLHKWVSDRIQPHVFEIGRTTAVELGSGCLKVKTDSTRECPNTLNRITPNPWPHLWQISFGLMSLLLLLSLAWLFIPEPRPKDAIGWTLVMLMFLGGLLGLAYLDHYKGEPFAWFEGVSLWPTQLIRLTAIILSWYLLVRGYRKVRDMKQQLTICFFDGNGTDKLIFCHRDEVSELHLKHDPLPVTRLGRVFLAVLLFYVLCSLLLVALGYPATPYRGTTSKWASCAILQVAIISFNVLVFYVVDVIVLYTQFIKKLCTKPPRWSPSTREQFGQKKLPDASAETDKQKNDDLNKYFNEWINIQCIAHSTKAVVQLVYYPIIIFGLLLLARARVFDNWNMSIGLALIFAISFLIIISCIIMLRRAAEEVRKIALDNLTKKLLLLKGQGSEMSSVAGQLEFIFNKIETIRDGAFAPFFEQPLFKAIAALSGTYGGFVLLEYLSLANI
ncbi:MAG: hypothetical protein H0U72_00625 [Nitrosospira sp.]|nr:hypothetical protein [Nitrosospira sp.]